MRTFRWLWIEPVSLRHKSVGPASLNNSNLFKASLALMLLLAFAATPRAGFLTSDITDPTNMRFHLLDTNNNRSSSYSPALTIQWNPLTSADGTNQNPVAAP
ncbi:MAG TPA: hypothetical protein VMD55_05350 [Terracidiphilus sp.]|nr:hypothetical protein [Terracidiphilus sp.]